MFLRRITTSRLVPLPVIIVVTPSSDYHKWLLGIKYCETERALRFNAKKIEIGKKSRSNTIQKNLL